MIAASPSIPGTIVVGRGRLGSALAGALRRAGGASSLMGGRETAAGGSEVSEALDRSGPGTLLLLAVPDDALPTLSGALASSVRRVPPGAAALHHSGSLGVDVLAPLLSLGFATGSCHPLQTFTGSARDATRFGGIVFAIAGEDAGRSAAALLARSLGGRPVTVPDSSRALYHLAASLGANGLTALVAAARDALAAAGLDRGEALDALGPLLRAALDEALRAGPESALTGPAARGDDGTLERQRRALLAWDATRAALFEALLREQRRLSPPGTGRGEC